MNQQRAGASMETLRERGPACIARGWPITPTEPNGKAPVLHKWPDVVVDFDRLDALVRTGHGEHGVGILTGRVRAVDIDVVDPAVADEIDAVAVRIFGAGLLRVGQWPKRLRVYRAADAPIPKRVSAGWRPPGAAAGDKAQRVEILGTGQQFVAFGIHPSTGRPYSWHDADGRAGGGDDPTTIAVDDLPAVTVDQVDAFLAECDAIFDWHGWTRHDRTGSTSSAPPGAPGAADDAFERLVAAQPKAGIGVDDVRAALARIPSDDRDVWLRVGAALHHQFGADGRELWDDWSETSAKFDPHDQAKTWRGFKADRAGGATILSVFELAGVPVPRPAPPAPVDVDQAAAEPVAPGDAFPGVLWRDVRADGEPARELVQGMFGYQQVSLIVAGTNVGKSAFEIDVAVAVASGTPWRNDRKVEQGPVLYIAAESPGSVRARALAIKAQARRAGLDVDDLPIYLTDARIDVRADGGRAFVRQVRATFAKFVEWFGREPVLVVVDTLAMAAPGIAENDADEMGALAATVQQMSRRIGNAHWAILHHLGKDADKGARGHSSLPAAVDTEIRLTFDEATRQVAGRVTKQRELPSRGFEFWFTIQGVPTGRVTNFGEVETQPVVVHDHAPAEPAMSRAEVGQRVRALSAIARDPAITQATVGAMFGKSEQAGKRLVDRLVADGLVARPRRGQTDLTPAGAAFLADHGSPDE